MFDSISLFGVLGALLAIASFSVLAKTVKVFIEMFHAQNSDVEVTVRTITMHTLISHMAIIAYAGGSLAALSMFPAELTVLAKNVLIATAGITAIAVYIASDTLIRRVS